MRNKKVIFLDKQGRSLKGESQAKLVQDFLKEHPGIDAETYTGYGGTAFHGAENLVKMIDSDRKVIILVLSEDQDGEVTAEGFYGGKALRLFRKKLLACREKDVFAPQEVWAAAYETALLFRTGKTPGQ